MIATPNLQYQVVPTIEYTDKLPQVILEHKQHEQLVIDPNHGYEDTEDWNNCFDFDIDYIIESSDDDLFSQDESSSEEDEPSFYIPYIEDMNQIDDDDSVIILEPEGSAEDPIYIDWMFYSFF